MLKSISNTSKQVGEICMSDGHLFYTVKENCVRCHFKGGCICSLATCSAIVPHRISPTYVAFIRLQRRRR